MDTEKYITEWVLDTIKKEYADDIAVVVAHNTLRINDKQQCMSYFVPITDRGRSFSQTFILEGIGFDIWGIEWERLERFAALDEYNITCIADGEVIYARTPEDRERFEMLKKSQAEKLADPLIQRAHALEAFAQAKQIYFEMLFSKRSDVKVGAAYVCDYLARAICFSNGGFFHKAQTEQLDELLRYGEIPKGFAELYDAVIREKDEKKQKEQCYELIGVVESYLERLEKNIPKEYNYQDLADWYGELSYTWLRIRHYCEKNDVTKAYMWGSMLQMELNQVCEDFGLEKMELMEIFDAENLSKFAEHADYLEKNMRNIIIHGGGKIREYQNREDFLNEV